MRRTDYHYQCMGQSVQGLRLDFHLFHPEAPHMTQGCAGLPSVDVLVLGAFHGDEPESAELCFRFLHDLHQEAQFGEGLSIGVLPIVNPDGLLQKTRKNARQVDLNRNFETENWASSLLEDVYHGGTLPFSEPESRCVAQIVHATQPTLILTYHTPYRLINFDGPLPQSEVWATIYATACDYPVEASIGYPTPGSFGNWAGVERGMTVLTVELPEGEAMNTLWPVHRRALQALFATLNSACKD
jgi:protein MpaA